MPMGGFRLMPWLKKKIVDPFMQIIRRGAEPKELAFSTALGITLGVFPICGTTVFLCGLAIGLVGNHCHAPSVMLANFIATPIELRSSGAHHSPVQCLELVRMITIFDPRRMFANYYYPFLLVVNRTVRFMGLLKSHHDHVGFYSLVVPFLRLGELICGGPRFPLTSDALKKVLTGQASRDVLISILHALLGWMIAAPFILGALYIILLPCFKLLVHRSNSRLSIPKKQHYPELRPKGRAV